MGTGEEMNANSDKRAARLGIAVDSLEMIAHLSDNEIKTQCCNDCGNVMRVHPGGKWRFNIHPIRCQACINELIAAGHLAFEARFVC